MNLKPKYKIGQIVSIKDIFSSNPAEDAIFISKIVAIKIKKGNSIFKNEVFHRILYILDGYNLAVPEKDIISYKEG